MKRKETEERGGSEKRIMNSFKKWSKKADFEVSGSRGVEGRGDRRSECKGRG